MESNLISACKQLICVPKTKIFFYDPITVKCGAKVLMKVYASMVTIDNKLTVMDQKEQWHEVKEGGLNARHIARELHYRLNKMMKQAA